MLRFVLSATLAMALANAAEVKRPRITGVAHYAIFVSDLAQARGFYKDFLGYGEPYDIKNPDGTLSMTFIKINERQYVEISPEKEAKTDRLNHTSVETDDIEGMRAYLKSKGITVPENKGKNRIGNMSFTIKDPEGHGVEFVQYMPGSFTLREAGKFAGPERISTRMAHFGIIVGALEPSVKFYRDILGFEETWRGSKDGKQLSWVNMKVPDGDDYVEFMLYDEKPAPTKRGSQHHICLFVPDMDKALATLEARPARAAYKLQLQIRTGINRKRQLNIFDPDGTRVELMEPHTIDGKPTPSATAPPPHQ